ncbi:MULTISPECIES: LysE family translocator [unclassified Caballeronia]|uniref:LysE family translocator n=1 Tax=unclassified Caballeronia TaxID=2646786 RepID=UPI002854C543|nr:MULTISPECIES: LysE family translocator [unclassified Caballeronia]MDR5738685.1 LysE family translocator [Caballeronia sp. LZ016]MDR5811446.1 LysE family translocator [Caballeronia sp. LZ019]
MSLQTFSLFVPACFAINMAFGPNNMLSLSNGAREGVRASVLASFGRLAAFAIMIAVAGLGLGALLLASETLFTAVKLAGAAYLVWIGVKLMRSGPSLAVNRDASAPAGVARLMRQEFFVAAGNPKAILVFTAFFPQFVDRTAYAASFAILGTIFLLLELVAIVIYAALGARLTSLSRGARRLGWFNRASGALMIGFGLMLAFVRRPAG